MSTAPSRQGGLPPDDTKENELTPKIVSRLDKFIIGQKPASAPSPSLSATGPAAQAPPELADEIAPRTS